MKLVKNSVEISSKSHVCLLGPIPHTVRVGEVHYLFPDMLHYCEQALAFLEHKSSLTRYLDINQFQFSLSCACAKTVSWLRKN